MTKLKLLAQTDDDLKIISGVVQDAIVQLSGVHYDAKGRYLSLRITRFQHELSQPARIESGLRIDGVLSLQSRGIARENPQAMAVLLNISFQEADAPAGEVLINFAGGGAMKLQVETLDMILADVGKSRATKSVPDHA